jgi:hypothetical protein
MLNLLRQKAVSTIPTGLDSETGDDLARSPALARIVEEGERATSDRESTANPKRSVREHVEPLYAFD